MKLKIRSLRGQLVLAAIASLVMSFVFVSPAGGAPIGTGSALAQAEGEAAEESAQAGNAGEGTTCLLYTSDAADE